MTRLAFVVAAAAAVFGAACEKSKTSSEEAPIQKGSTPKPLPPPPPKAVEPPPAEIKKTDPPVADPKGGDPHGDHAAQPGATVPPPTDPPVVGTKLAMDTVRPPEASDLAEYLKGVPGKGKLRATIDTTMGAFHCELYEKETPMTVANFVGLATGQKPWTNPNTNAVEKGKPLYNGIIFHRVISGFMIQGGDPLGQGTGGPGYNFDDEVATPFKMDAPGILAMANAGRGTNGSQFFITEAPAEWLTGKHTIFGKCDEVALVKKITAVPKDGNDRPNQPISIKKITFARK